MFEALRINIDRFGPLFFNSLKNRSFTLKIEQLETVSKNVSIYILLQTRIQEKTINAQNMRDVYNNIM